LQVSPEEAPRVNLMVSGAIVTAIRSKPMYKAKDNREFERQLKEDVSQLAP